MGNGIYLGVNVDHVATVREAIIEISKRCSELPDIDARSADAILGHDEHGGFR